MSNDGDEGPSAAVKEEEGKDGAAEAASKEAAADMETADNKPPGDKYSPKVRVRKQLPDFPLPSCPHAQPRVVN